MYIRTSIILFGSGIPGSAETIQKTHDVMLLIALTLTA